MATSNDSGQARAAFALTLLCAAFLITTTRMAQAGINVWTTHGPYGGPVNVLAIDPSTPSTLGHCVSAWRDAIAAAIMIVLVTLVPSRLSAGIVPHIVNRCTGGRS